MNSKKSVYDCGVIEMRRIEDEKGSLTAMEGGVNLPFSLERVFYLYDIPGGEARGAHAHKECHQFLVAAHGSFEVVLDDGVNKRTVTLNRPYYGLHIPPGIWAAEQEFSSGAICLVMTSHKYDEADYIREYHDYLKFVTTMREGGGKTLRINVLCAFSGVCRGTQLRKEVRRVS